MEDIVNIGTVKVDASLPKEARLRQFVEDIKNPYRFLVDDVIVNAVFTDTGNTLQDRLLQYFQLVMV